MMLYVLSMHAGELCLILPGLLLGHPLIKGHLAVVLAALNGDSWEANAGFFPPDNCGGGCSQVLSCLALVHVRRVTIGPLGVLYDLINSCRNGVVDRCF